MMDIEALRAALDSAYPREEIDLEALRRVLDEFSVLHALVNSPQTTDFLEATRLEVVHQVQRWGKVHDRAKAPADWFWLVGYLAGKALQAAHEVHHLSKLSLPSPETQKVIERHREKALHHTISSAAVLANWHTAIKLGSSEFTPGASDLQRMLEEVFGTALERQQ